MSTELKILFADADNVVAHRDRLLVQYRRGALTVEVIERIATEGSLLRAGFTGQTTALLAVVAQGAPTNPPDVRERSLEVIRGFAGHPGTRIGIAVEGDDLAAIAMRTVTRGLFLGRPGMRARGTVDELAPWIAEHIGISTAEVISTVERVRRAALTAQPG
jgi:hypothetical protein